MSETTATLPPSSIAIVGMAGRFPGARDLPTFWANLRAGRECRTELSDDDLRAAEVDEALRADPGYVRAAFVLDDIERFDAEFFGMSPKQARLTDPQQRLFLETAWLALDQAGATAGDPAQVVGVFAGSTISNYLLTTGLGRLVRTIGADGSLETLLGNDKDYLATLTSYKLNLRGPSVAVQTACSSSLVAIHLACQSLLAGECTLALAGGVTVRVPHRAGYLHRPDAPYSPDGHCRAFDADAKGSVFGSGVGVVALRRLADALTDGDTIRAVIRGSAVNNDGARKMAFSAPSQDGQAAVIAEALDIAEVEPASIDYIEAHGTGTALGDPIEVAALTQVFGAGAGPATCALGSLKTSIGHLETAAGVAGLIKTVLALEHGELPPSLNFDRPNPHLHLEAGPFHVNAALAPWPRRAGRPRRAGVSSFGIGGTNAHVIVEEAPARVPVPATPAQPAVVVVSGKTPTALATQARALAEQLASADIDVADLAYTTCVRRTHHRYRLAVTGESAGELSRELAAVADGPSPAPVAGELRGKLVYVCAGQGGQWLGMARGLLGKASAFDGAIDACERALAPLWDRSLRRELEAPAERSGLGDIGVLQPLLFAIQVSLAAQWQAWGITPDAVVGHSLGEVAAAHLSGALTLDDAARVICTRADLLRSVAGRGAMAVVGLSVAEAEQLIDGVRDRLSTAVSNGPTSTVLSGDPVALAELLEQLKQRNVFCQVLRSDAAGHSPHMDELLSPLQRALQSLRPRASTIPIYSTVTGGVIDGASLGAAYWARNLRELVRFHDATDRLIDDGHTVFLELGPHPMLQFAVEQNLERRRLAGVYVSSLQRDRDERRSLQQALGALHVGGRALPWDQICRPGRVVALPAYPFEGERHWVRPEDLGTRGRPARRSRAAHPILGELVASPLARAHWQTTVGPTAPAYLADHRFDDDVLMPGSAYACMMLAAAAQLDDRDSITVADLTLAQVMPISGDGRRVALTVTEDARMQIHSRAEDLGPAADAMAATHPWRLHASARLDSTPRHPAPLPLEIPPDLTPEVTAELAERMASAGYQLGPAFHWLAAGRRGEGQAHAVLRAPSPDEAALGALHPGVLDAGFQLVALAAGPELLREARAAGELVVPVEIGALTWWRTTGAARAVTAQVTARGPHELVADIAVWDSAGAPILHARDTRVRRIPRAVLHRHLRPAPIDSTYELTWQRAAPPATREDLAGRWLIVADRGGVAAALGDALVARGARIDWMTGDATPAAQRAALDREPTRGVVHLASLDAAVSLPAHLDPARLAAPAASVLASLQAVASAGPSTPIWIVTRGAQAVAGSPLTVQQAPIWGLWRAAQAEHAELLRAIIDLEPTAADDAPAELAELLVRELAGGEPMAEVAWRQGQRWVPQLVRRALAPADGTWALRDDATYLVTGAMGGLGAVICRWLVQRGARHLALVSRRAPTITDAALIDELVRAGAAVALHQLDIADSGAVVQLVAALDERWPLRGVVHAAGELDDGIVLEQTPARLARVMAGKALGAWNLHVATQRHTLELFALFSSTASVLGSAGQANYAAANAFLDGLAAHRRQHGLPAVSVGWGPWAEVGRAATLAADAWATHGVAGIETGDGLAVLGAALADGAWDPVVFPARWDRYLAARRQAPPRLRALAPAPSGPPGGAPSPTAFAALPPAEARRELERLVATEVRSLLGLTPGSPLDPRRGFFELGFDSLRAIELKGRLTAVVGRGFAASALFEHATCEALARYLADEVLGLPADLAPATASAAPAVTVSTERAVADGEVLDRLDAILSRFEDRS